MGYRHELAFQLLQQQQRVQVYLKNQQRKYQKYILDLVEKFHLVLKQVLHHLDEQRHQLHLKIVELVPQIRHKLNLLIHLLLLHPSLGQLKDQQKLLNEYLDQLRYSMRSQLMDVNEFPKRLW